MEPLSASSGVSPVLRPAHALQADLSAVLRQGQVVAGEVLHRMDGGTVLIGIGRHRVPAEAQAELDPGRKLLLSVEREGGELLLRVMPEAAGGSAALVAALRGVAGQELSVGELLERLAAGLRAGAGSSGAARAAGAAGGSEAAARQGLDARIASLTGELERQAFRRDFRPGTGGAELARALARSGTSHEAGLLRLALLGGTEKTLAAALRDVADEGIRTWIARARAGGVVLAEGDVQSAVRMLEPLLSAAAAELARTSARAGGEGLEALLARLAERIRGTLSALPGGALRDALLAGLRDSAGHVLSGTRSANLLRGLIRALAAGPGDAGALRASVAGDLKGGLLALLTELEPGPMRETVSRALAGIEVDQLMNLARQEAGEPLHWSMPVPDAGRWTTVHLFHRDGGQGSDGRTGGSSRLVVGVDLTHLGPVRADLLLRPESVSVRILVTRPEVAERLRAQADEWTRRVPSGDRSVQVSVVVGSASDVDVAAMARDIRFLREHHLMDVAG